MKIGFIIGITIISLAIISFFVNIGFWGYYAWHWTKAMNLGGLGFEWSDKTWTPLITALCSLILMWVGFFTMIIFKK